MNTIKRQNPYTVNNLYCLEIFCVKSGDLRIIILNQSTHGRSTRHIILVVVVIILYLLTKFQESINELAMAIFGIKHKRTILQHQKKKKKIDNLAN